MALSYWLRPGHFKLLYEFFSDSERDYGLNNR